MNKERDKFVLGSLQGLTPINSREKFTFDGGVPAERGSNHAITAELTAMINWNSTQQLPADQAEVKTAPPVQPQVQPQVLGASHAPSKRTPNREPSRRTQASPKHQPSKRPRNRNLNLGCGFAGHLTLQSVLDSQSASPRKLQAGDASRSSQLATDTTASLRRPGDAQAHLHLLTKRAVLQRLAQKPQAAQKAPDSPARIVFCVRPQAGLLKELVQAPEEAPENPEPPAGECGEPRAPRPARRVLSDHLHLYLGDRVPSCRPGLEGASSKREGKQADGAGAPQQSERGSERPGTKLASAFGSKLRSTKNRQDRPATTSSHTLQHLLEKVQAKLQLGRDRPPPNPNM